MQGSEACCVLFARCAMRSRTGTSALCTLSVRGPAGPKMAVESLLGGISAEIALFVSFTVFTLSNHCEARAL